MSGCKYPKSKCIWTPSPQKKKGGDYESGLDSSRLDFLSPFDDFFAFNQKLSLFIFCLFL